MKPTTHYNRKAIGIYRGVSDFTTNPLGLETAIPQTFHQLDEADKRSLVKAILARMDEDEAADVIGKALADMDNALLVLLVRNENSAIWEKIYDYAGDALADDIDEQFQMLAMARDQEIEIARSHIRRFYNRSIVRGFSAC